MILLFAKEKIIIAGLQVLPLIQLIFLIFSSFFFFIYILYMKKRRRIAACYSIKYK